MNSLYTALYELLSYITEDAQAHKLNNNGFPSSLMKKLNEVCIELGDYLDTLECDPD